MQPVSSNCDVLNNAKWRHSSCAATLLVIAWMMIASRLVALGKVPSARMAYEPKFRRQQPHSGVEQGCGIIVVPSPSSSHPTARIRQGCGSGIGQAKQHDDGD